MDALNRFMEVPGYIPVYQQSEDKQTSYKGTTVSHVISLHLDSIESCHVHLYESVLPVVAWDPGVVDAP